jgi:membrane protein
MALRKLKPSVPTGRVEPIRRKIPRWQIAGLSPLELGRRLFESVVKDDLLTRAAALSYYSIFALFPMLLSLLATVGLFAQVADLHGTLGKRIGQLMPPTALALVEKTIREISLHSTRWKLVFGLLLALWSGSGSMGCIMDALDRAYRVQRSQPFWKRQAIAVGLTALVSVLTFVALVIVLAGGILADFVGEHTGLSQATIAIWQALEWPVALLFVLLALALIYCFGPAVRRPWRWVTPGSVVSVLVWVLASLLFRLYLRFFSTYGRSYGSLGAVMVLLLWLYITGLAIVLGAEINAEIDRAKALRGRDGKS